MCLALTTSIKRIKRGHPALQTRETGKFPRHTRKRDAREAEATIDCSGYPNTTKQGVAREDATNT